MIMTDELRDKVLALHRKGMAQRAIAEHLGLSKGTVYYAIHGRNPSLRMAVLKEGELYIDDEGVTRRYEGKTRSGKLTPLSVKEIRQRYFHENATQRALAREYDVTELTIFNVVHYRTWKDV